MRAVGRALDFAREFSRRSVASDEEVIEIQYALPSASFDEAAAEAAVSRVHKLAKVTRGSGSPACAGIGPKPSRCRTRHSRFPRLRGDRPQIPGRQLSADRVLDPRAALSEIVSAPISVARISTPITPPAAAPARKPSSSAIDRGRDGAATANAIGTPPPSSTTPSSMACPSTVSRTSHVGAYP